MAVKSLDEIVSGLSAQEKTFLDNLFEKEPELRGGWLRQDDYSRKQTELRTKLSQADEAIAYKDRMEPWAATTYEKLQKLQEAGVVDEEGNEVWTTQKRNLEQELEQARQNALAGGDMTPEEIRKTVEDIVKAAGGGLTKDEIAALYQQESKKTFDESWKEREQKFNTETIPFVGGFSAATAVVAMHYEQETGEKWTAEKQKELYGLMSAKQNFDPFALEEEILAPHREKKRREADIEAEVQKRIGNFRSMPGAGNEEYIPQDTKGALQQALERSSAGSNNIEDVIRENVVKAAKELQLQGK